jgi:hypothetical protein
LKGEGGYGYLFRSEKCFRTTRELEYLYFLSRKARIFFLEFHIRIYDKNFESDYFFFYTKIRILFFSNVGNQNNYKKKNITPPPFQVKWSFPNINGIQINDSEFLISQYADDSTLILEDETQSLNHVLDVVELFSTWSSLRASFDKTQAVWIGARRGCGYELQTNKPI